MLGNKVVSQEEWLKACQPPPIDVGSAGNGGVRPARPNHQPFSGVWKFEQGTGAHSAPLLWCATPPFAIGPKFLTRLTVQAFGVGLIRACLGDCVFIRRARRRRRRSLRRRAEGSDDKRQDGRVKCHRSDHDASCLARPL
jgi:hypothetical protein